MRLPHGIVDRLSHYKPTPDYESVYAVIDGGLLGACFPLEKRDIVMNETSGIPKPGITQMLL